jgi:hypothetical protein
MGSIPVDRRAPVWVIWQKEGRPGGPKQNKKGSFFLFLIIVHQKLILTRKKTKKKKKRKPLSDKWREKG